MDEGGSERLLHVNLRCTLPNNHTIYISSIVNRVKFYVFCLAGSAHLARPE